MDLGRFAMLVLRRPWLTMLAAILVMAASGGAYDYPIYSNSLMTKLGYHHKRLANLALLKNVGASSGLLPGLLINEKVAPPWVVLVLGATMNLVGNLMPYLAVSGRTARPPPWLMYVYVYVAANAQSFSSTAALVTTVNSFPGNRGLVLGMLMGFGGLSAAILAQLYRAVYSTGDDGAGLLLVMACVPSAISLVSAGKIRGVIPPRATEAAAPGERRGIWGFIGVSALVALCLVILYVIQAKVPDALHRPGYYATTILVLAVILLLVPLALVVMQELRAYYMQPAASAPPRPAARVQQDCTVMQALFTVDMLLLFIVTGCGIGGTLTALDNISLIGQALGYGERTSTMLVSVASLSNYAGRVVAGLGSDYLVERCKLPRPLALAAALLLACVGHVLIAVGVLHAASAIIGFSLGAQWTLLFAVISELFGLRHFSALYNIAALASPVGYYVLNVLVTGRLYDRHAAGAGGTDKTCVGVQCLRTPFAINAVVAGLGMVLSVSLAWRTRAFYGGDSRISAGGGIASDDVTTESSIELSADV